MAQAITKSWNIKTPAKIYGVRDVQISHAFDEVTSIKIELLADPHYNAHHLLTEKWDDLFPGDVILKCAHCGQFAARKTACKYCGAPVG